MVEIKKKQNNCGKTGHSRLRCETKAAERRAKQNGNYKKNI